MYAITAHEKNRDDTLVEFDVVVAQGDNEFEYEVTLPRAYFRLHSKSKCSEKEFVERAFRFLLAHELPAQILKKFKLPLIQKYF